MLTTLLWRFYYLLPRRRPGDGRYCNAVRPSVCLSVTFNFRTVTWKRIDVLSRNFAGTCTMSWGVLHSFWYWWNVVWQTFFRKTILFHFTFYAIFSIKKNWKYWKVPLHLLVKWEVVSPNSRYRDNGNLYTGTCIYIYVQYIIYSLVLILYLKCGGGWGGGGVFFLHFMLFPTFLEFLFIFKLLFFIWCFLCVFFPNIFRIFLWKYWKVLLHFWLNGRWLISK